MNRVCNEIRRSFMRLLQHQSFQKWFAGEKCEPGDYLIVNNSFIFRDVKTKKSNYYICAIAENNKDISTNPQIISTEPFNSDFKRFSKRSTNLPDRINLDEAVLRELKKIGQIIFVLIGEIHEIPITEQVGHKAFHCIEWDPSANQPFLVLGDKIIVRAIHNEEAIWSAIEHHYQSVGQDVPKDLREAIGATLDRLQDNAIAEVEIPALGTKHAKGLIAAIVESLMGQRDQYKQHLHTFLETNDSSSFNEILRISYNFTSDITNLIRLIVSICDLKPIVLWGTIAEHFALSEALRNLPWMTSRNKPSLSNYERIVADARNYTFHHLFPFRKTLKIPLPDTALQGAELRIFSEHSRKKQNRLSYPDEEIVNVLKEFTRAREQFPSIRFWQQNLQVIDATIELFKSTSDFIKVLHADISDIRSIQSIADGINHGYQQRY